MVGSVACSALMRDSRTDLKVPAPFLIETEQIFVFNKLSSCMIIEGMNSASNNSFGNDEHRKTSEERCALPTWYWYYDGKVLVVRDRD